MTDSLAVELSAVAGRLSTAQVRAWRGILDGAAGPAGAVEAALIDVQAGLGLTGVARHLVSVWRTHAPTLPGNAVALALAAAAVAHEEAQRRRPRLVVSGPTSAAVAVRLTSSVVTEVIRAAVDRVLVVSFAAYGVAEVVRELAGAADRGVRVDLVLESTVEQGGALRAGSGSGAFDILADRATFWHWPAEHRRSAGRAALHAKVVVADGGHALLSSANLTDRGLADNIEVGFLVHDQDTAGRLERHFRALMRAEARCLCPVRRPGA
ncbi:DISARM system phospholipase D-like protein DrmC [Actinokineospora sp.]|uniref:DISARM system phospholipase D-like protein DrmC n=1 Tax=Actinokineospora sp. TaxID=1872133 RepID=UPI004037601D